MKFFVYGPFLNLLFSLFFLYPLTARDSNLGGNLDQETNREPLFVSLGSNCKTAHMHKACGIRKAAFPFDWIVSFDGKKLIDILEEDFLHFLNPDVLKISGLALLNHQYYLEFLNEGDWEDADYDIKAFSEKCQRRINRFRQLATYQGKVFFVRTAYRYSLSDPHRIWKFEENIEITREYADQLHKTLKKFFPNLDFELIIINDYDEAGCLIEEQLPDGILMIRIDGTIESYKDFYNKKLALLKEYSTKSTD